MHHILLQYSLSFFDRVTSVVPPKTFPSIHEIIKFNARSAGTKVEEREREEDAHELCNKTRRKKNRLSYIYIEIPTYLTTPAGLSVCFLLVTL